MRLRTIQNTINDSPPPSHVMFTEFPDLLSINELQKALKISKNTAYCLIQNGSIKHMKIGRAIRIPKQFLIDFVFASCYNERTATGNLSCHS